MSNLNLSSLRISGKKRSQSSRSVSNAAENDSGMIEENRSSVSRRAGGRTRMIEDARSSVSRRAGGMQMMRAGGGSGNDDDYQDDDVQEDNQSMASRRTGRRSSQRQIMGPRSMSARQGGEMQSYRSGYSRRTAVRTRAVESAMSRSGGMVMVPYHTHNHDDYDEDYHSGGSADYCVEGYAEEGYAIGRYDEEMEFVNDHASSRGSRRLQLRGKDERSETRSRRTTTHDREIEDLRSEQSLYDGPTAQERIDAVVAARSNSGRSKSGRSNTRSVAASRRSHAATERERPYRNTTKTVTKTTTKTTRSGSDDGFDDESVVSRMDMERAREESLVTFKQERERSRRSTTVQKRTSRSSNTGGGGESSTRNKSTFESNSLDMNLNLNMDMNMNMDNSNSNADGGGSGGLGFKYTGTSMDMSVFGKGDEVKMQSDMKFKSEPDGTKSFHDQQSLHIKFG